MFTLYGLWFHFCLYLHVKQDDGKSFMPLEAQIGVVESHMCVCSRDY
jgi:hypothetical protein